MKALPKPYINEEIAYTLCYSNKGKGLYYSNKGSVNITVIKGVLKLQ